MQFKPLVVLSGLCTAVSAHFQLQYPPPRGVFVEKDEVTFCDNYATAADNRTTFPLSNGFISLNSEHPLWDLSVLLSTQQNPPNFQAFSTAVPFFQVTGAGFFCFPVDFAASGISGLTDGMNVTIQLAYNGGDDPLYQCADLTLSSNASVPSSISCTNATGDSVSILPSSAQASLTAAANSSATMSMTGSTSGSSSSSSAPAATSSSAAVAQSALSISGLLGLASIVLSLL